MAGFDNAKIVMINDKEVDSIKTNDGGIIYQRPTKIVVTGNSITLGKTTRNWLIGDDGVTINWGDGTSSVYNQSVYSTTMNHTYTDGKSNHTITFVGIVTQLTGAFQDSNIISIVIPDGVVTLGRYCFEKCANLNSVVLPNSVTSLGLQCFAQCTSLTTIIFPNSITNIDSLCFNGCTSLTNITIPNSITNLGDNCFYGCTALVNYQLYWTGDNIITYNSNKMPNNTNTKFYVPKGQKTNYVNKGYPSAKVIERS